MNTVYIKKLSLFVKYGEKWGERINENNKKNRNNNCMYANDYQWYYLGF